MDALLTYVVIQWLACIAPVIMFHNRKVACQSDPACRIHDTATLWNTRRAYAAVMWSQFIQPMGSSLAVVLVKPGKSRRSHIARAIGIGLVVMVVTCVLGLRIYDHYPRPRYWSPGDTLLEAYFIFPVFPILSAVIGGAVFGAIDWRFWIGRKVHQGSIIDRSG
jgi:hypothetical protein